MKWLGRIQSGRRFRSGLCGLLLSLFCALSVQARISFKLELDSDQVTYRVFMISAVSYKQPQSIIASTFVTIHVPHRTGASQFVPVNIDSPTLGMRWTLAGRSNAPRENPDRDYLYFSFANGIPNFVQFDIVAGQPYLLFTFKRQGPCLGAAQLIDNATDEFRTPNSHNTNVANYIAVLGGGKYSSNLGAPPTISVTASKTAVCAGETIQIQAKPSVPASSGATYLYQLFADGQAIDPAGSSTTFTYTLPQRPADYTTHLRVKLVVKRTTLCEEEFAAATIPVNVRVLPKAQISYTGEPCALLPVSLSAIGIPLASYQWLSDGKTMPGETSPTLSVSASGNYTVRLTLNSCSAVSTSQPIIGQSQAERVTVRIPALPTVVAGTPIQITPQLTNVQSVSWSPGTGLSSVTATDPVATPTETTTYTLTGWSQMGCPSSDTVTVHIIPTLYIPDAFTPNGDGVNDVWVVQNAQHHTNCVVSVYDRWGGLIFQTTQYDQPWNGQASGVGVEPGVYTYIIQTPYAVYKGTVSLIR